MFLLEQESYRQKQQDDPAPTRGIALVMNKETSQPKKKMLLKIKIKKKVVVAGAGAGEEGAEEGSQYE